MSDALDALSTTAPKATASPQSLLDESGLGRDAFLKIFLAQLETQDPLNPQDSTQLSSQLAQFSQLEQTLRSTTQLENIGTKLDQLIELSGGGKAQLDPVSLIGREVEFAGKRLTISEDGNGPAVAGELQRTTRTLVFKVTDRATGDASLAVLTPPADENGQPRNLPLGAYRLRVEDGVAVLAAPTAEGTLEFRRLVRKPDGTLVPDETGNPLRFTPGSSYDVEITSVSPNEERNEISLRRSGVVSSVRIANGTPILKIDGTDVDITTIQQIR